MASLSSALQFPESSALPGLASASHAAYDVYIHHRGPDVKMTLASHLYRGLRSHGLRVFLDKEELDAGYDIASEIKQAIETASVHVAIFSPRYAESSWCLDELLLILQSKAPIVPVYYNVRPAELRCTPGKDGLYANAIQNLEKKETFDPQTGESMPRYNSDMIQKWRDALFSVSERSGFDLEAFNGDDGQLLDGIVECVLRLVKKTHSKYISSSTTQNPGISALPGLSSASHAAYDVYIHHRGPDVKKTFASHLYRGLRSHGLRVFLDTEEVEKGYSIASQIEQAIKTASLHVAIFSPHYADSSWCLDELLLILQSEAPILPVFYHVRTAELRGATGKYGRYADAIQKLENQKIFDPETAESSPRYNSDWIQKWRDALSSVSQISGFDLDAFNGDEGELLDKVVECVLKKVKKTSSYAAEYISSSTTQNPGISALPYASGASTSISNYIFDVFINYHGQEVKKTFANHLYHRLVFYGLRPFLDGEERLEDNITTQTKEAIATASVHVAIFSLRYAESRRCLDELLLMLDSGAPVFPVFYNVKRFDLQWTKDKDGAYAGVYGSALQSHEKRTAYEFLQTSEEKPRDISDTIEEWRKALYRISVPEISGFELSEFIGDEKNERTSDKAELLEEVVKSGDKAELLKEVVKSGAEAELLEEVVKSGAEAELLDAVVKRVLEKVRKAPFYEVKYLKGLDQKVEDFENTVLLHRQNRKPQVVGIVGVAGVGKTTLAKELINRKSSSFNRACFLFDVSGTVARSPLHFLQSKLFKDLTAMNIQIKDVPQGIELFTKHFSSSYGVTAFVILDNVDNVDQLKALLPVRHFLSSKSLILITSQSKDVLIRSGVEKSLIYNLTDLPLDKHPSYLEGKVKELTNTILLQQRSEEPQVLGIVGISGIGKTKLAMEFFNRKSSDYTRSYFFYDVNETARTSSILHNLQSKLLQGLTQLDLQVQEVDESIDLFKEHVSYFRSLVILDNVDHWDQLHALLSVLTVLPTGSLILVTCRKVEVLKRSGVQETSIYNLNHLNTEDSFKLFCTHAFSETITRLEFEHLVLEFVSACNGLPLTLKMFGALLWGKIYRSYWIEQLHKLRQIHPDQIERRLKLCYDELNEEEQNIFLHIARSCVGAKRDLAVRLWDASGSIGLSVFESLQKRCLVDVNSEDCIIMHEHLRELGRTIADEEGLLRPTRPRRENDPDLLRQPSNERLMTEQRRSYDDLSQQSSVIREVRGFMIIILILMMAMMIWSTGLTIILITMIAGMMIWNMGQRN